MPTLPEIAPQIAPKPPAETFGQRFMAEFSDVSEDAVRADIAVLRRQAVRVLRGIPWQFIPSERCERRAIVGLRTLLLLCCCLDVIAEGGGRARPGNVSAQSLWLAWKAAGRENWLKRVMLQQLRRSADREVLAQHSDLLVGAIASQLERTA